MGYILRPTACLTTTYIYEINFGNGTRQVMTYIFMKKPKNVTQKNYSLLYFPHFRVGPMFIVHTQNTGTPKLPLTYIRMHCLLISSIFLINDIKYRIGLYFQYSFHFIHCSRYKKLWHARLGRIANNKILHYMISTFLLIKIVPSILYVFAIF